MPIRSCKAEELKIMVSELAPNLTFKFTLNKDIKKFISIDQGQIW